MMKQTKTTRPQPTDAEIQHVLTLRNIADCIGVEVAALEEQLEQLEALHLAASDRWAKAHYQTYNAPKG